MEDMKQSPNEDVKKLGSLIKDVGIAMLTTMEADGSLRSRPMATQKAEFEGTLWFFTREHSPKVDEVNREHRVNVSYSDPGHSRYVSVSGTAELSTDAAKIKELWQPLLKAWFPMGLEDPELALLKVTVDKAEYWDAPGSMVVKLVGFVKAIATGKTYEPGKHEKIDVAHA